MGMPVWGHVMTVAHEENCQFEKMGIFANIVVLSVNIQPIFGFEW